MKPSTGIDIMQAKAKLDSLLSHMTKNEVARRTGLSLITVTRIDNLSRKTVLQSTIDILDKAFDDTTRLR
jgi:hypothetical protein